MKNKWGKIKKLTYPGLPITATISRETLRELKKWHNIKQQDTLKIVDEMVGQAIIQDSIKFGK